jgi:hypothetical protein
MIENPLNSRRLIAIGARLIHFEREKFRKSGMFTRGEDIALARSSRSSLRRCVTNHPRLFAAAWFVLAVSVLIIPFCLLSISIVLLYSPSFPILPLSLLLTGLLPLILAGLFAVLIGDRIIYLTPEKTPQAGFYGMLIGLGAFISWLVILEILPNSGGFNVGTVPPGDIPGAAIAVAYLVVLPGTVIVVLAMTFLIGITLHITASNVKNTSGRTQKGD